MPKADLELLAGWYERCDPDRRLTPQELRDWYVPFDAFPSREGRTLSLRGPSASELLIRHIRLASRGMQGSSAQLFAGFRGTGKSTELARVEQELAATGEYVVLRVNAEDYWNGTHTLTPEELALILAAGVEEAANARLELGVRGPSGVWDQIMGELKALESSLKLDLKLDFGPVELAANLQRGGPSFREKLNRLLGERPEHLRSFLHGRIARLSQRLGSPRLVVLVDGLEKFSAAADEVALVYKGMADLFYHQDELLRLPGCHVVYTIPPYLRFLNKGLETQYRGIRTLPNIKVQGRPPLREPFGPGVEALEQVVAKRINLDQLFGQQRRSLVERLVLASGGHVRELLLLMGEVIGHALDHGLPVSAAGVDEAIRLRADQKGNFFFRSTRELLREVAETGRIEPRDDDGLSALSRAMDDFLVLCYYNGEPWYDVHPLVLDRATQKEHSGS